MNTLTRRRVAGSAELQRILAIPRRTWTAGDLDTLAAEFTAALKTPAGTMHLRPIQALALHDLGTTGGLFGPIGVGEGKTLLSLLAPFVLEAKRPLLLLPAALISKTEREQRALSAHWKIPRNLRILSYEMLGRIQAASTLEYWRPDLVIADEAHRLKNPRAGVTRRVARYMKEHPETRFAAISGTMLKSSLNDFGRILRWSLKDSAPVPNNDGELSEWADALDENSNFLQRSHPGALLDLATPDERTSLDAQTAARRGFQRRLTETAGVVATTGEQVACSLYIRAMPLAVSATTEKNFETLRTLWETPDGWPLSEAVAVWRCARELALGMHYIWSPRPPDSWLMPRRLWSKFVRDTLARSRTLDTELQVSLACAKGHLPATFYNEWKTVKDSFIPHPKAVWHDDSALDACAAWLKKGPGIVWVEHTFFAEELSRRTGLPYFGAGGVDRRGTAIEAARGGIIASVAANGTGRNLQAWSRNLITSCPTGAAQWEQLLGRTHRQGQTADQVEVDVLFACTEHFDGYTKARAGAEMARDTLGQIQKLLFADCDFPTAEEVKSLRGYRWAKNS